MVPLPAHRAELPKARLALNAVAPAPAALVGAGLGVGVGLRRCEWNVLLAVGSRARHNVARLRRAGARRCDSAGLAEQQQLLAALSKEPRDVVLRERAAGCNAHRAGRDTLATELARDIEADVIDAEAMALCARHSVHFCLVEKVKANWAPQFAKILWAER